MAAKIIGTSAKVLLRGRFVVSTQPCRNRHKAVHRGKWPEEARSFEQRLEEIYAKDPELDRMVNIGFPLPLVRQSKRSEKEKERQWQKARREFEYAARHKELTVDLTEVKKKWHAEQGPSHIRKIIEHYGIFNDLFGTAFFYNTTQMSVSYDYDDEFVTPVYFGNRIPPSEAALPPYVEWESESDALWTLVMTSPDGHLLPSHRPRECLHWMVCNIPGSDVEKGETMCNYLQPFPVKGVGYLRYVFVLYRQKEKLEHFNAQRKAPNCKSLSERVFSTQEFYDQMQDNLTPASVCFFQSQWDTSVKSVFHNVLEMREPSYEFIRPPNYHPRQVRYPHKQPFNLYLDRYRDTKDIQESVLKERLKQVDPLTPPPAKPVYPNTFKTSRSTPSWLKQRIKNMRLGKHQWKDLHPPE